MIQRERETIIANMNILLRIIWNYILYSILNVVSFILECLCSDFGALLFYFYFFATQTCSLILLYDYFNH